MLRIRIPCGRTYCLRRFGTATRDERWESVDVKCGSSGSIGIDLYNTKALTNPNTPLIIYLPPKGVHARSTHPAIPSPLLHPSTSLAKINYRWNSLSSSSSSPSPFPNNNNPFSPSSLSNHRFPTPLHDILHAYTYLTYRFSASTPQPSHSVSQRIHAPAFPRLKTQRPIIIYGSFLSGALATSLALTESRQRGHGDGVRIAGLIVKDGVFDFSSLALLREEDVGEEGEGGGKVWTARQLHGLKKQLFASPAGTFDSFASPMFFFRTSGVYVPKVWPGEEESSASSTAGLWADGFLGFDGEGEPIFSSLSTSSTSTPSTSQTSNSTEGEGTSVKEAMLTPPTTPKGKRITEMEMPPPPGKAHLRFPPSNTDLVIPPTLFLYTNPTRISSSPTPSPSPSPKTKTKSQASISARRSAKSKSTTTSLTEIKKEMGLGGMNPESQTREMRALMVRSVRLYEGRDLDGDPRELGEERVGIEGIVGEGDGEEDEILGGWIEDLVGDGKG